MKRSGMISRTLPLLATVGLLAVRSLDAQSLTTLHAFRTLDGINPAAGLTLGGDGNFYGTTQYGGCVNGTVFKVTPSGTVTILYAFGTYPNDGANPQAALVLGADGNFYGTTLQGGNQNAGTVFKITPAGMETVLYTFGANATDGFGPNELIKASDGNFYGTTQSGGSYDNGTFFEITPSGTETILYSFGATTTDGAVPLAALVRVRLRAP